MIFFIGVIPPPSKNKILKPDPNRNMDNRSGIFAASIISECGFSVNEKSEEDHSRESYLRINLQIFPACLQFLQRLLLREESLDDMLCLEYNGPAVS
jgi:hypothetical protein